MNITFIQVELQNPILCYEKPYSEKLSKEKTITWSQTYQILMNCKIEIDTVETISSSYEKDVGGLWEKHKENLLSVSENKSCLYGVM